MMRAKVGRTHRLGGLALAAALGTAGVYGSLVACSVSQSGTGPGTDAGADGAVDAGSGEEEAAAEAAPEAAPCTGLSCDGMCLDASDCRGCSSAPLLCAPSGKCMAACDTCQDEGGAKLSIGCFACDKGHRNPLGSCQYNDASSYCLSGDYFGSYAEGGAGYQCDCSSGGVASCPGANQVCASTGTIALCFTCGETTTANIDGKPCKNGKTCALASAACQ